MLCSSATHPSMAFSSHGYAVQQDVPSRTQSPASHASSSSSGGSAASASGRPRNHVRSGSSEARFFAASASLPTPPLPATSATPPPTPDLASASHPQPMSCVPAPSALAKPKGMKTFSPTVTAAPVNDEERLRQLQSSQANKRPRMLRLTPAYQSSPTIRTVTNIAPSSDAIEFPAKVSSTSADAAAPSSTTPLPQASRKAMAMRANGNATSAEGPHVGLQVSLDFLPASNEGQAPSSASVMVRKKSGEPVKSSLKYGPSSASAFLVRADSTPTVLPSSIRAGHKSAPNTPSAPKAVHFDSNLEHVKVFKHKQRPTAVSRDGSPEQTETETEEEKEPYPFLTGFARRTSDQGTLHTSSSTRNGPATPPAGESEEQLVLRLPNFPSSTRLRVDRDVFLERIFLADDLRSVKGTVRVRNLSFEKWVAVRFTLDGWATVNEVSAEYAESIPVDSALSAGSSNCTPPAGADRFAFSIKLNELLNWPRGAGQHETKSMSLCLRYTVGGREIWDNNDGLNYQLDFRKRQVAHSNVTSAVSSPDQHSASAASVPSASARNRNNTIPRRSAPVAAEHATRVVGLVRNSGVHGVPPPAGARVEAGRGGFAMEDLRRELNRLKADEEEEDLRLAQNELQWSNHTRVRELAINKSSPPTSPGGPAGARSASPTGGSGGIWSARYDFGQSLRNPQSGSRTTGAGRAAALDYFSSKPSPGVGGTLPRRGHYHSHSHAGSSSASLSEVNKAGMPASATVDSTTGTYHGPASALRNAFISPSASPSFTRDGQSSLSPPSSNSASSTPRSSNFPAIRELSTETSPNQSSPDFSHKLSMFSPGLGQFHVEHKPVVSTATPSPLLEVYSEVGTPEANPESPPSSGALAVPTGQRGLHAKFYSYPPRRGVAGSPGSLSPSRLAFELDADGSSGDEHHASRSERYGSPGSNYHGSGSPATPQAQQLGSPARNPEEALRVDLCRLPRDLSDAFATEVNIVDGALTGKVTKDDGLVLSNYVHGGEEVVNHVVRTNNAGDNNSVRRMLGVNLAGMSSMVYGNGDEASLSPSPVPSFSGSTHGSPNPFSPSSSLASIESDTSFSLGADDSPCYSFSPVEELGLNGRSRASITPRGVHVLSPVDLDPESRSLGHKSFAGSSDSAISSIVGDGERVGRDVSVDSSRTRTPSNESFTSYSDSLPDSDGKKGSDALTASISSASSAASTGSDTSMVTAHENLSFSDMVARFCWNAAGDEPEGQPSLAGDDTFRAGDGSPAAVNSGWSTPTIPR